MAGREKYTIGYTQPMIKHVRWDSVFFNLKIGRVDVELATIDFFVDTIKKKRSSGYDLIYLFADRLDKKANSWINKNGIIPVDIKLTFHKTIQDTLQNTSLQIEKYNGNVSSKLLNLAIESGHKSRFRKDERLSSRFKDMYQVWIEKSVNGELADVVLVSNQNYEISGFVTVKKNSNEGTIGLIAVDQLLRGRGIARSLLIAAENWCSSEGCRDLIVNTQLENIEACNFYLRNGYLRQCSKYIFHI